MFSSAPSPRDAQAAPHWHQPAASSSLNDQHEDPLVSALHAAFQTYSSSEPYPSPSHSSPGATDRELDMGRVSYASGKEKVFDIVVASDQLILRGTGVDVEPALLSGHVVLNLTEPTSIKQINLVFRGKARVPSSNSTDPHILNNSPSQYIVCNHEWSFLEGHKSHSHTLKAGRHLFPFELRLGGSLPSSIATYVNGGASVSYKLRATAVRPGFSSNLTVSQPIAITRTFAPESLEYQQTLEIENTWPEKLMYALMIPHKAWAAGDEMTTVVKFASLTKGVKVLCITTNLCETTKTLVKGGHLEKTRTVVSRRHEIVRGRAVSVDDAQKRRLHQMLQNTLASSSSPAGNSRLHLATHGQSQSGSATPYYIADSASAFVSGTSTPAVDGAGVHHTRHSFATTSSNSSSSSSQENIDTTSDSTTTSQEDDDNDPAADTEITTSVSIRLPTSLTPSHQLDPIIVSYRIRWSIMLSNLDGHTSELRCSLPIHILDFSLLNDARKATSVTRRLLLGAPDAAPDAAEEDAQLPSYSSHVRDRIAVAPEVHAFLPYTFVADHTQDSGTSTPMEQNAGGGGFPGFARLSSHPHNHSFSASSMSTTLPQPTPGARGARGDSVSGSSSGTQSPLAGILDHSGAVGTSASGSLPRAYTGHAYGLSSTIPVDIPSSRPGSRHGRERFGSVDSMTDGDRDNRDGSGGGGRGWFSRSSRTSRVNSRVGSRAASPERSMSMTSLGATSGGAAGNAADGLHTGPSVAGAHETHVHSNNSGSRQQHGLFSAMMKPVTGLSAQFSHSHSHAMALTQSFSHSHSHSHPHLNFHASGGGSPLHTLTSSLPSSLPHTPDGHRGGFASQASHTSDLANHSPEAHHSPSFAFVPDYTTASRSVDIAPLESLRGLPNYEDSEAQAHSSAPASGFGTPLRSSPSLAQVAS